MGRVISILGGLVILVALVSGGVVVGWKIADHHTYARLNAYPLLDPSVSNSGVHREIINFDPLRQNLKQYLSGLNLSHSLYFEYLPNGANIRNGADNNSVAASLLKVPIVMDLYRLAEMGQINLDQQVTVQAKDISTDSDYGDPTHLKPGDTLTLRQAAKITMQDSDNTTLAVMKDSVIPLLNDNTDSIQSLDVSYSTIGNTPGTEQVTISSMYYSSILKCLYYACFNSPQDSTQILNYLSGSVESGRLEAGVPSGIRVAHKVGSSLTSQSDCGIIYLPGKPYLVCMMFFDIPSSVHNIDADFQQVSQMIYNYVNTSGNN